MSDPPTLQDFLRSGQVSMEAARKTIERAKGAAAQAAPAQSGSAKKAKLPSAATNKPKPTHAVAGKKARKRKRY